MNKINGIQKSIEQLGEDAVLRYVPKGMKLHPCDIHGKFLAHYKDSNPLCPLCSAPSGNGNGTTASDIELFIDLKDAVNKEINHEEMILSTHEL